MPFHQKHWHKQNTLELFLRISFTIKRKSMVVWLCMVVQGKWRTVWQMHTANLSAECVKTFKHRMIRAQACTSFSHTHPAPCTLSSLYFLQRLVRLWNLICLLPAAWFSGYTPLLLFCLSMNSFFLAPQSEGFKQREDAGGKGGGHAHVAYARSCQGSLKVNTEMWKSFQIPVVLVWY